MTCVQFVPLPHASVAVQVLVMVYSCGHPPAAVTSLYVTTGAGSQLSVALARPVFAGSVLSVTFYRNVGRTCGDRRWCTIVHRHKLGTICSVAACVCRCPCPCDGILLWTCASSSNIAVGYNRCRVTIICCTGQACIGWQCTVSAFYRNVCRTCGDRRRCAIVNSDDLCTICSIAACVCRCPCPCDGILLWTCASSSYIAVGYNWCRITIIGRNGQPGIRRKCAVSTFYGNVCRTCGDRRCYAVINSHDLCTICAIATSICRRPCPCNRILLWTCASSSYIAVGYNWCRITIIGRNGQPGIRRKCAVSTFYGNVCRTCGDRRCYAVINSNDLRTIRSVTTCICRRPSPCNRILLWTCASSSYIAVGYNWCRITIIGRTRQSGIRRKRAVCTFYGNVCRTCGNGRWCTIVNRDNLGTIRSVAACICSRPGPCNRIFLWTSASGCYIAVGHNRCRITIICCTCQAGIGRIVCCLYILS